MSEALKQALYQTSLRVFRVMARLLLQAHIGIGEAYAVLKVAYVLEAKGERGGHGRANIARISTATGLTWAEVATLLELPPGELPAVRTGQARDESVMSGWWTDKRFLDPHTGRPAVLKLTDGPNSFVKLVKTYSGDSRWRVILDALLEAGAARRLPDGSVQALSTTCMNLSWNPASVVSLGEELAAHGHAGVHNVLHPEHPFYVRRVQHTLFDPEESRILVPELQENADDLMESAKITLDQARHPKGTRAPHGGLRLTMQIQLVQEALEPQPAAGPSPPRRDSNTRTRARRKSTRARARDSLT